MSKTTRRERFKTLSALLREIRPLWEKSWNILVSVWVIEESDPRLTHFYGLDRG
jgi:hypothetical protein